jgi:Tfp pilus assembly protein PilF/peroxiredoxin
MRGPVAALLIAALASGAVAAQDERSVYRPKLAVSEVLAPFLDHIEPGKDGFPEERHAVDIEARLRVLGEALKAGENGAWSSVGQLFAPDFRGARLPHGDAAAPGAQQALEIRRVDAPSQDLAVDARAFGRELQRLAAGMRRVTVTEFLVTAIQPADQKGTLRSEVRYDVVGTGEGGSRLQHVGVWRIGWRSDASGWQAVDWRAASHATSRAARPLFAEVTDAALGSNESFRRQLTIGLDAWMASLDSVLTRDSNGHHGVSVGDADGDGREDLYVAQPAGLPNRLFRARGDSSFEDITERSGLGILDDTAQSLFADIDNDGDQDLVLSTGTRPLLFVNNGSGNFAIAADAFTFQRPLQGVLTSMAMADYDRDGFLDLYLCVYSYFFGAGEDKAGTPAPYYDARNGPPGVLFRNDGRGRFVDVTDQAGLGAGNDRYHFAAAWADYDGNGWPDLLVANDFGTKNLYRNKGGSFEDAAEQAGVLDHGAGMSATFLDYDNDGLLDIYTGNMWSASGLRVTSAAAFMPEAPAAVRALYRRHARGNALFRNRGDGRFDDRTVEARAEIGRWAWSSDALDADSDGWDDLYVVNGMLTRDGGRDDLDSFFWRQVVARSPLTRVKGTSYDDAWRAINQLLIRGSIASRQRNVFLRNDGKGGFEDVSGALGLDLDQDGRSFAAFDLEGDGDADLAVMAARQAPQLRVFRNDFPTRPTLTVRLVGSKSNRDAVGARVVIETDVLRRTKIVQAGSGFISQQSKSLLFGLGASRQVRRLAVEWPSGQKQEFTDVPLSGRLRLVEGGALEKEVNPTASSGTAASRAPLKGSTVPEATWLYEPFPAPDFTLQDTSGETRSLAALRGRPALLLIWSKDVPASRAALDALQAGQSALTAAGVSSIGVAVDDRPEVALSYAILNRHLFMNRQDLRVPTAFLLDTAGQVVKAYRERLDVAEVVRDARTIEASPAERLSRALPFSGTLHSAPPTRNYLPYGRELLDQGLEAAAVVAFERAAQASPSASTLYRLGTLLAKTHETGRARAAFERALSLQPDLAEANNDLGALLAQEGDLEGAIARFRAALVATPEYPDALNNLGYALLLTGNDQEARGLYEKALALQPDFPEALNNLGLLFGRAGDLDKAEGYFRRALDGRAGYGEAANNLALVMVARGQADAAVTLLEDLLRTSPQFEAAYITLAKIHLSANRTRDGVSVLERLLQRNPAHPAALELLRQFRSR